MLDYNIIVCGVVALVLQGFNWDIPAISYDILSIG